MLFETTSWLLASETEENKVKTHHAYILTLLWLIDWTVSNRIRGNNVLILFCDHALTFCFTENRIHNAYPSCSPVFLYFVIFHDIRFVIYCVLFLQTLIHLFSSRCTFCTIYNCILFICMIYYNNVQSYLFLLLLFLLLFIFLYLILIQE
jgi:hypothetical protein